MLTENFLQIKSITKDFGETKVLQNIDIDINEAEFLVLVGPSGCGKSTLLNIIAGLDEPTSGEIHINNNNVTNLQPSDRDIAMVFQSYALYPNMTVAGNIAFGMEMRKVPKEEREEAIDKVAKILHIEQLLERKPGQLSGGQRQRVAMGRAMVRNPKIFLFDEPLSNLDAKLRVDMRTEIKRLHQTLNATIVYVTHDQIEAMTLATNIVVMEGGQIKQFGTPEEIYNQPNDMYVARFIGSPAMNIFPVKLNIADGVASVEVTDKNGTKSELKVNQTIQNPPSEVMLGLRPELVGDSKEFSDNQFSAIVDVVEPSGADTYVITELNGHEVTARLPGNFKINPGEQMTFGCDMTRAVLFDKETEKRIP